MSFLWDLIQQRQISESREKAAVADIKATVGQRDLKLMEQRLDALCLASQAIWEIFSEKYGVSEAELLSKVEEIDLRDGVLDGALNETLVLKCSECGHQMKKRLNCYWCGAKMQPGSPFAK